MAQRSVLVTGATGLLGREVAKEFRLGNWTVKGTGHSRADNVDTFKMDLGDSNQVKQTLDQVSYVPYMTAAGE
jgi:NAD(P)-dependent dehydrogenase (short-subunit alcohol dehydrogenase family)